METDLQNRTMTAPALLMGSPDFFSTTELEQPDLKKSERRRGWDRTKSDNKTKQKKSQESQQLSSPKRLRKYVSKVAYTAEETGEQRAVEEFRHEGSTINHLKLHGNTAACTRRVTITVTANWSMPKTINRTKVLFLSLHRFFYLPWSVLFMFCCLRVQT